MEKTLEEAWQQAHSIESREEAGGDLEYIGSVVGTNREYEFFRDDEGAYWYRTWIILKDGTAVSEQAAIFGQKKKKR